MKPTLVDNCEHYNYQTHQCNKCGRGLPDVCLEFENMKKAAAAYEQQNAKGADRAVGAPNDAGDHNVASLDAAPVAKPRGRPKQVKS